MRGILFNCWELLVFRERFCLIMLVSFAEFRESRDTSVDHCTPKSKYSNHDLSHLNSSFQCQMALRILAQYEVSEHR